MKKIVIAFATILLVISCKNENSPGNSVATLQRDIKNEEKPVGIVDEKNQKTNIVNGDISDVPPQNEPEKTKQTQQVPQAKPDWDKKIIKTAALNLKVKDYNAYNSSLRDKIKQAGGYVAQEQQTQSDYKIENAISIKVPVDQFDNAVTLITSGVEELNEKKITSQDVTTEVVDVRSRLESKKQVRLRYLDLLKQAKNMQDILSVQSEISGIQEEIESAAGRIEYLSHSSSFSTINLTFYQVLNESAKDAEKISFGTKVGAAFKTGWSWIGELLVAIVSIWPLLLLIFVGFIIYKRTKPSKIKQA